MAIEDLNYRELTAYNLRRCGHTYRSIGDALGVSLSRARDLTLKATRKLARERDALSDLPTRVGNCLKAGGYRTRAEVIQGIESGELSPRTLINYGRHSHEVVCRWLGIEAGDK